MIDSFFKGSVYLLKRILFFLLIFSLSGCATTSRRTRTDRKRGLMLLENTSQSLNKKYKKTKYSKKAARRHKRGHR